ncbi:UNVERIFIED_ORG: hypothetical protein GGE64_006683 [Rhizobium etli]
MARMTDDHTACQYHDLNALADQTPRHGVAVRVEVDCAIGLNLAHEIPQLPERRAASQRAKRPSLRGKAFRWRYASRAVFTLVGNIAYPPVQMRFECRPALEPAVRTIVAPATVCRVAVPWAVRCE